MIKVIGKYSLWGLMAFTSMQTSVTLALEPVPCLDSEFFENFPLEQRGALLQEKARNLILDRALFALTYGRYQLRSDVPLDRLNTIAANCLHCLSTSGDCLEREASIAFDQIAIESASSGGDECAKCLSPLRAQLEIARTKCLDGTAECDAAWFTKIANQITVVNDANSKLQDARKAYEAVIKKILDTCGPTNGSKEYLDCEKTFYSELATATAKKAPFEQKYATELGKLATLMKNHALCVKSKCSEWESVKASASNRCPKCQF